MTPKQEESELIACHKALFSHMDEDEFRGFIKTFHSPAERVWIGWQARAEIAIKECVIFQPFPETESGNEGEPIENL